MRTGSPLSPGVTDLRIDLTDAGQVFDALCGYAGFDELEPGTGVPNDDAVVHFAAIPAILIRPCAVSTHIHCALRAHRDRCT